MSWAEEAVRHWGSLKGQDTQRRKGESSWPDIRDKSENLLGHYRECVTICRHGLILTKSGPRTIIKDIVSKQRELYVIFFFLIVPTVSDLVTFS